PRDRAHSSAAPSSARAAFSSAASKNPNIATLSPCVWLCSRSSIAATRPTTRSERTARSSATSACSKNGFFDGVNRSCSASGTGRVGAPGGRVLMGYYASGRCCVCPAAAAERWLASWDLCFLGDPPTRFARWPRAWLAYFEIVYMGCFLLVPAGFGVLAAA